MRRISLLTASALALTLTAPAFAAETMAPGADKPSQLERAAPADKSDTGTTMPGKDEKTMPDKSMSSDKVTPTDKETTQKGGFITQQATNQTLADEVIGAKVEGPNKENIGKISDLVLDDQNRVVAAVLSVGGFLGIGDKNVAVAWDELKIEKRDDEQVALVTLSKEQLKSAPEFKTQADIKSEHEAERRKVEQPSSGSGGQKR